MLLGCAFQDDPSPSEARPLPISQPRLRMEKDSMLVALKRSRFGIFRNRRDGSPALSDESPKGRIAMERVLGNTPGPLLREEQARLPSVRRRYPFGDVPSPLASVTIVTVVVPAGLTATAVSAPLASSRTA
jgi:hypothetical protein